MSLQIVLSQAAVSQLLQCMSSIHQILVLTAVVVVASTAVCCPVQLYRHGGVDLLSRELRPVVLQYDEEWDQSHVSHSKIITDADRQTDSCLARLVCLESPAY